MPNGRDTLKEIKDLLSEKGQISTPTAMRLSLDIQVQMYEEQVNQGKRLAQLEGRSIGNWIANHPKAFLGLLGLYIIVSPMIDVPKILAFITTLR